jgi:hypothetical protein
MIGRERTEHSQIVKQADVVALIALLPAEFPGETAAINFHHYTDPSSKDFVPPEERVATFDQDGTLLVEHPIYTQVVYCLDRVPIVVKAKPELAKVEPFKDRAHRRLS